MDKINNILYYTALMLLFGFFVYFFRSRSLVTVFAVFLIFPFVSFAAAKTAFNSIKTGVFADVIWVEKGSEVTAELVLKNPTPFPILNCAVTFRAENRFFPNDRINTLNFSVPCMGEYSTDIPMTFTRCGMVNISLESMEIKDLLNFFSFKKEIKNAPSCFFYVRPSGENVSFSHTDSELYNEDSLIMHKNASGTQPDGIRDYSGGDKLHNIHWKLSAKAEKLLVKEYSDSYEESAIILAEMYRPAIDDITENVFGIGKALLEKGMCFTLAFSSAGREQLEKIFVSNEKELLGGIEKIYLSCVSENDNNSLYALRREYAGGGVVYIHGGADEKAVTEIL